MKVTVDLYGWADSFFGNKIILPLQIAMNECVGDCDFFFQIKKKSLSGGGVNTPYRVEVIASRCCAYGYNDTQETMDFNIYEFSFEVDQYTKSLIYQGAKNCLKNKRFTIETIEMLIKEV